MIRDIFLVSILLLTLVMPIPIQSSDTDLKKSNILVKFRNEESPFKVISIFVLPTERLPLEIRASNITGEYLFQTNSGIIKRVSRNLWRWQAPNHPGLYPAQLVNSSTGDSILLNIFVMVPRSMIKNGLLNGYRIGDYPSFPLKGLSIYNQPKGFIEVTPENENVQLSPSFTLKQFLCKQEDGYPKYIVLKERLVLKLEMILEHINKNGLKCKTLAIMSGYRTPFYNKAIENVKYSQHIFGNAADIYIDERPEDGIMDDLNNDGRINYQDADRIYDIIDNLYGKPWYQRFIGGLARYEKTTDHGPFVHIDTRGFRARWGD